MEKFIKIYNQIVYSASRVIHISLIGIGLWLIFIEHRYIEGSLLCIVDGVWGIENILFEKFVVTAESQPSTGSGLKEEKK